MTENPLQKDVELAVQPAGAEASPIQQPATSTPRHGHDGTNGRFIAGNRDSLKHGGFSQQVRNALTPEQVEVLAALAEKRAEIERDLGGSENLSVLARDLANRYLELCVVADYLGGKLVTQGPLTPRGHQRAALTAYLGVVDRLHRLAMALGLERRQKLIHPLDAVQRAVEEANRQ
jgi:hypothetical protein